jgi:hypothetical protein
MRSVSLVSALAAVTAVQAGAVKPRQTKITPVTAKGNAFYVGDQRFYVRGVDYQPGGSSANLDPLADPKICTPDIEKFQKLGINVIRVYSTDNSKDHSECMNLLADAGIYVVLDANNPLYSINREKPAPSYNAEYLQSIFATIDEFGKFDNTMAFFSGNEVIHDLVETTRAARFVKAVTRDMRQYIRTRFNRQILVGYSAADVQENRMQTAAYFNCGPDDERSDFFAFVSASRSLGLIDSLLTQSAERLLLVHQRLHHLGLGQEGPELHRLRPPHLPLRVRLHPERARLRRARVAHALQHDLGLLWRSHVRIHLRGEQVRHRQDRRQGTAGTPQGAA